MNILWITNSLMPEVCNKLKVRGASSGHWVSSLANELQKVSSIKLYVATISPRVSKLETFTGERISYYVLPAESDQNKYHKEYEQYWTLIKNEINPDIIDIHGTEYPVGLSYVKACGSKHVVVTLQGLVSEIEKYYAGGISDMTIMRNTTIRDILVEGSIFAQRRKMQKRGRYEIELIKSVSNVIGRTSWDRAHAFAINPDLKYFIGHESLRPEMYEADWDYSDCKKHSIYVSQCYYPLKGFHNLLRALPLVLKKYPDTIIRAAGVIPLKQDSFLNRLKISGYGKYLKSIIKKYKLEEHVLFIGPQSASQVRDELLSANIFISTSSVENSSNAIGEAQLIGVPCLASFVGGSPDMVDFGRCGTLYRYDDVESLAFYICELFEKSECFDSSIEKDFATKRHDKNQIINDLIKTYEVICQQ